MEVLVEASMERIPPTLWWAVDARSRARRGVAATWPYPLPSTLAPNQRPENYNFLTGPPMGGRPPFRVRVRVRIKNKSMEERVEARGSSHYFHTEAASMESSIPSTEDSEASMEASIPSMEAKLP